MRAPHPLLQECACSRRALHHAAGDWSFHSGCSLTPVALPPAGDPKCRGGSISVAPSSPSRPPPPSITAGFPPRRGLDLLCGFGVLPPPPPPPPAPHPSKGWATSGLSWLTITGTHGGRPGQRVEEQGTWASCTQKHSKAGHGRPVDRGTWTAKTVKRPRQQPAQPPIRQLLGPADAQTAHPATSSTVPTHQLLGSANAETTPARAPPQRPTERSDPTQRAKGRTGDCPGPREGTTIRWNVTQGGWLGIGEICNGKINSKSVVRSSASADAVPPPPLFGVIHVTYPQVWQWMCNLL